MQLVLLLLPALSLAVLLDTMFSNHSTWFQQILRPILYRHIHAPPSIYEFALFLVMTARPHDLGLPGDTNWDEFEQAAVDALMRRVGAVLQGEKGEMGDSDEAGSGEDLFDNKDAEEEEAEHADGLQALLDGLLLLFPS